MTLFSDLVQNETLDGVRTRIIGYAQAAGLRITNWLVGGVGQQTLETVAQISYTFIRIVPRIVRGFTSLDLSTDPGDEDAYDDDNANLPAASGFLSAYGENVHDTTREGSTFASGFVTFVNAGAVARTFAPFGLVFTWTGGSPPSPAPTYRNTLDPAIYTNPDGTVTVGAGTSIVLPIQAEEIGSRSSAPSSTLSLTTTLVGCTATNAAAVLGADREDAQTYRARCRLSAARLSLAGPAAAYEYLAAKNLDGSPLLNALGTPSNINRAQVSQDSSVGVVRAFFAAPAGGAASADVTAANSNIRIQAFAVPDAITYSGQAAPNVSIHVTGTARIKNRSGLDVAAVKAAIVAALAVAFRSFPVGGLDQVAGAGVIYTDDIQGIAAGAYPGLYNVLVAGPVAASTALAMGSVAVLTTAPSDWTVTVT